jgi:hypothetical protein
LANFRTIYSYHILKKYRNLVVNGIEDACGDSVMSVLFQFGIAGVLIIATLTDHCIQVMLNCKNAFIEQICRESVAVKSVDSADVPRLRERLQLSVTYGDLGQRVYGSWCFHLIQFAVWFTQFTTCISYCIFIGNTVYEMFPLRDAVVPINGSHVGLNFKDLSSVLDNELFLSNGNSTDIHSSTAPDLRVIVVWCVPVFIATSLVRKMRYLAPLSFVATVALVLGIVAVLAFVTSGNSSR